MSAGLLEVEGLVVDPDRVGDSTGTIAALLGEPGDPADAVLDDLHELVVVEAIARWLEDHD